MKRSPHVSTAENPTARATKLGTLSRSFARGALTAAGCQPAVRAGTSTAPDPPLIGVCGRSDAFEKPHDDEVLRMAVML